MKICGFLSLISYFLAIAFVVIAEAFCPGVAESGITVIIFFILVLTGAALAYIQNDERFDHYVFLKNDRMTDEDYEELINRIEARKKEVSAQERKATVEWVRN